MAQEEKYNPIDVWAAIQKMQSEKGWKFFMERFQREGDDILSKILDINTPNEQRYSYRDLCVFQLHALGRAKKILDEFEELAKLEVQRQKQPQHIGK